VLAGRKLSWRDRWAVFQGPRRLADESRVGTADPGPALFAAGQAVSGSLLERDERPAVVAEALKEVVKIEGVQVVHVEEETLSDGTSSFRAAFRIANTPPFPSCD
jgi:hypothetical protein